MHTQYVAAYVLCINVIVCVCVYIVANIHARSCKCDTNKHDSHALSIVNALLFGSDRIRIEQLVFSLDLRHVLVSVL